MSQPKRVPDPLSTARNVTGPTFADVIRRQRMVRPPYADRPVATELVSALITDTQKSPSAGYTQGVSFLVLEGRQTERFWELVRPDDGPTATPVVILPLENQAAYLNRYSKPDKLSTGLGDGADRWPAPYWTVDTAFATMTLLLSATAHGLGAWFFGLFRGEAQLLAEHGIPAGIRPIGAVTLGYPADRKVAPSSLGKTGSSRSYAPDRKQLADIAHFGRWATDVSGEQRETGRHH